VSAVVVSGSAGLIGSEAVQFYCERGHLVVGIDNDMRRQFFGADASTIWKRDALVADYPQYTHHHIDIRDRPAIEALFREYGSDIARAVSSMRKFTADYPGWVQRFDLRATLEQILQQHVIRWV
jgi:CDP-paratose 2-epimerase